MRKIYILILLLTAFGASSCNDWLDIRANTEQKDEEQFSTAQGFYDALIGCYMTMADRNIYGEQLSITYSEALACLWDLPKEQTETNRLAEWFFQHHDYTQSTAESAIQSVYAALFNTVAQANMIIKNVEERGEVIPNPDIRSAIEGEAYAIRAYCQLDVLRLFGEVPGGSRKVSLPYSETTSINDIPPYYDFEDYVAKLKADIEMAKSLLIDKDPVFQYSFASLNSGSTAPVDEFMLYRQFRMNYWAVRALEARMLLYTGEKSQAHDVAMEIISARLNGNPVISLSNADDFTNGYKLCPSECLFGLSKYNVMTYSETYLIGGNLNIQYDSRNHLTITPDRLDALYTGVNTNAHNRYRYWWNSNLRDTYGDRRVTTTKYYWDVNVVENASLKYAYIPMLRMSEIYLIAMEGTTSLEEANSLFSTYMIAHEDPDTPGFASLDDRAEFLLNEYRREFFAEGQMFYTYKRLNTAQMLWDNEPMTEDGYILPLPRTEYNPNN